jgi:hypothetical protein
MLPVMAVSLGVVVMALSAPAAAVIGASTGVLGSGVIALMTARSQRVERAKDREHDLAVHLLQLNQDLQRVNAQFSHERNQRLGDEMLRATSEFAAAIGWVLRQMVHPKADGIEKLLPQVTKRMDTAASLLGTIEVLFPRASDVVGHAGTAYQMATSAVIPLRALCEIQPASARENHPFAGQLWKANTEAFKAFRTYAAAAAEAIAQDPG